MPRRHKCNKCQLLRINGIVCHEIGCPNIKLPKIDCWECGTPFTPKAKWDKICHRHRNRH